MINQFSLDRILLVDDEPDIRLIAQRALESVGGFTVRPCTDGEDALSKIEAFDPQLILMDVMMPGKDGPTTMAELRKIKHFSRVPIVFITARVQKTEVEEYLAQGASEVISKPFNPMTLSSQIQKVWSESQE